MTRHFIKNTLFALVSIIFVLSATAKFAGREAVVELFTSAGMAPYITRLALIQIIITLCLWYKPLRSLGVLVASAFLGGIIFMMMATNSSPLSAGLTLILLWVAYKLEWWGYWDHYKDNCGCGWCKRSKGHHDVCACKAGCVCKRGECTCK